MVVQKQIEYWRKSSQEDIKVAELLFQNEWFRHALFFAHLAVEKVLKAHVTKQTCRIPPKIHNLSRLAELAQLSLTPEQQVFLRDLGVYQIEGRYPDLLPEVVDGATARKDITRVKELLEWLTRQL
jgi:HEPN domain-containing protein